MSRLHSVLRLFLIGQLLGLAYISAIHVSTWVLTSVPVWAGMLCQTLCVFAATLPLLAMLRFVPPAVRADRTSRLPRLLLVLALVVIAYGWLISPLHSLLVLNQGSGPSIVDGRYFLMRGAMVIAELTPAQYELHRMYELRAVSAFYMAWFVVLASATWRHIQALCTHQKSQGSANESA